jgi:hypothetical protein
LHRPGIIGHRPAEIARGFEQAAAVVEGFAVGGVYFSSPGVVGDGAIEIPAVGVGRAAIGDQRGEILAGEFSRFNRAGARADLLIPGNVGIAGAS